MHSCGVGQEATTRSKVIMSNYKNGGGDGSQILICKHSLLFNCS